jgi:hypothetical protein
MLSTTCGLRTKPNQPGINFVHTAMPLSRPIKIAIGVLTAWPVLYLFPFFSFIAGLMIWMSRSVSGGGPESSEPPVAFFLLFAAHCATILLMFGLLAFYVVFLFKTDRVPQDQKALWAVVLFFASLLAMPVFFYLYVWPNEWPRCKLGAEGK